MIAVAAKPGGPEAPDITEAQGITELIEVRDRLPTSELALLASD